MHQFIAKRSITPLLLGAALLAACSGGSPSAAGGPGGTSGPGATGGATAGGGAAVNAPDRGAHANAPMAPPGPGTNPTNVGPGAPPPAAAQNQAAVAFNSDAANGLFIDPVSDASKATNLFFGGQWAVAGGYLEQSQGARMASLSFRQYVGDGFGTQGGVAPGRYRADVTVWVYQPSAQYPEMVGSPLGILGYAPYYLDETHYLLAVAKPTAIEVWAVDGAQPGTEWPITNRLYKRDLAEALQVGSPVAWSVEIDAAAQSARVWANGEELTTVTHPLIQDRGQRVALISNGNFLHFQDFKVFRL